ncbi:hypothetical protein GLYMA_04G003200v4 [Glycine max]|nr:hypothetical protein GLYMA_04G003200v4 [Glycine max]KAH1109126.1 hypothetical protein GYH30_008494 [Glycine max]
MINGHMVTLLNPVLSKVALYLLIPNLPLSELWHKKASTLEFSRSSSRMSKEVSQQRKDYVDPPPAPLIDLAEIKLWSFYRALIAEFIATLLFLYVTVATVIGHKKQTGPCDGVGLLGIAWAFGGMIFVLVYCTAGISGGHINPAVTFGLFLARKVSLIRALFYMVAQCLGAICGVGLVKAFMKHSYNSLGGGANSVSAGYNKGSALGAEIIGTFVLVYTVFSATDPKRSARDSHIPQGASVLLLSTTMAKFGMTIGYSGLDHSWERWRRRRTISTS